MVKSVHLDFHTSPDIPDIGAQFDKEEFTRTLKKAKVDLVNVFGKCHHGYTYYPSKVGTMHPNLKFNLLKEQIEAIHAAGAKAPIYLTVGWSKKDADEHPEWQYIDFATKQPLYYGSVPSGNLDESIKDCSWTTLCPSGPYLEHIKALTHEVCQEFAPVDGIFYDIFLMKDACVCEACKKGMREMGLDPEVLADAQKYYRIKRIEDMKILSGIVHSYNPEATVFYNSGGADMNRPEYHPYSTHYELEDLPTAWAGYDVMPIRAKFFEKYGKHFMGMTGKFHHNWGEFGGFKNKEALKYEVADMMSVGSSMGIGDHLHPSGKVDESTYAEIGYAFNYISQIEQYGENTKPYTDLAHWLRHQKDSNFGASKLLHIMHLEYDVIDSSENLGNYKCVILPDAVKLTDADKKALVEYAANGGKIVASYESIFDELGVEKIAPSEFNNDYIRCDLEDNVTPFLSYSSAYKVKCDGEVLADVYEPYFNRTWRHFCGHKNTPFRTEKAEYPALVRKGNVVYFAHPVFEAYNKSGNYVLERYIMKGIDLVYDRGIRIENLPSCGRVRLRKSEKNKFFALHVLYAPPINRGNVCLLEDFPTLHDVKLTVRVDENIKEVIMEPEGERLEFTQSGNELTFTLKPFHTHKLVALKW